MRRKYLLGICTLILALLVTACGGNSGDNESKESPASSGQAASGEASAPASEKASDEVVTLKFMGWEVSPLESESVKAGLKIFEEQNPNIKVEYTTIPGGTAYIQKMQAMMLGNEAPDVFFIQSDYYRDFVKRDYLLDISNYVSTDFEAGDLVQSAVDLSTVDGKYYGIESCIVAPVLYYNKAIFDKAGIPYPPSKPGEALGWDQFVELSKKLTDKESGQYGVYGLENYYMTTAEIISNGGNWFNGDYTASAANTPEVKEVLQKIKDLREVEGASPEAKLLQNSGMSAAQMLQTGKIAMLVDGSWALQEISHMDFPVGMAVLPKFQNAVTHGQAHLHSAWANTKHAEEAWKLVKFLSSEEYQLMNVKAGLWLPNRKSLFSEEGISKWLTPGVHPDSFKDLIPYFTESAVYPYSMLASQQMQNDTNAELDKFFFGKQSADDTSASIEKMVNEDFTKLK
ncbi:extracellular solute-binding protein [Cohnella suwonensis]|uniref:Extracellular solute-binding protein n=1 Tax=Cohnella suwonensis TaxID=696072 RepID=A0ABW0M3L2_9BACL